MSQITYRTWYNELVNTTDATVTTIATLAIPTDTTNSIEIYVTARRTGGAAGANGDSAYYRGRLLINNVAGTVNIIGSELSTAFESQAGWNVTYAVSTTNILIQVTGAVNNNITWYIEYRVKELP